MKAIFDFISRRGRNVHAPSCSRASGAKVVSSTAGGVTHQAGAQWLVAENTAAQSPYFGVLDPTKLGAAGHSQGGGATIAAGAGEPEPSGFVTTLPLMPIPNFEQDLSILGRQLVPMFSIVATKEDRDPTFAKRLFDESNVEKP